MGFKCGIVGLPNVGKSTLFNALTASKNAEAANFPFCTIDPNIGIVDVVDGRLDSLSKLSNSKTHLNQINSNMKIGVIQNIQRAQTVLDRKSDEFKYKAKESLRLNEQRLLHAQDKLLVKSLMYIDMNNQTLSNFEKQFELLEPSSILKRGYSISRINGKLIKNLKVSSNDEMVTEYSEGLVVSVVKTTNK